MNFNIDILLATYNGEFFIEEQLKSLFEQSYQNFKILVRDDGSKDRTLEIVRQYQKYYPGRIEIIVDDDRGLGPSGNFGRLLQYSTAPYIMFCDQDDVWLENKIERTLAEMKKVEAKSEKDFPILIHSDLIVVNKDLNIIKESMSKSQKLYAHQNEFHQLLIQNNITGCTMMINKPLLKYAFPIPQEAIMHDWWLGIIASAYGKVQYIDEGLILYRQHGSNDVGAQIFNLRYILKKINFKSINEAKESVYRTVKQSRRLQKTGYQLPKKYKEINEAYSKIYSYNKFKRVSTLFKYKLFKKGILRNLALLFVI